MNTHASAPGLLPLEEPAPDDRTFLNASVWFVDSDGYRVVFRWHEPLYRVALADAVHLRLVAVALRQSRLATQAEICRAFGHNISTQARWERQYRQHAIDGLVSKKRTGRRRELDKSQEGVLRKWFRAGWSNRQMAKRLGVDEATIRRTMKRLGLVRRPVEVPRMLPQIEDQAAEVASAEALEPAPAAVVESVGEAPAEMVSLAVVPPAPSPEPCGQDPAVSVEPPRVSSFTVDHDPRDRSGDRLLAREGLLEDAVPLFANAECLPRAGVLLAVPLLVRHGLIGAFVKVYGSLQPSFYGLRTIVVTLFLGALLRIKRPEHWKEYRPADLGAILGLDRAPEVKTVRRKFTRMAAMERGKLLMEEVARQRIAQDEERVAFLYVDGHVREYHGKFPLFEAKKAQRQVVTPAATDTWVHDADGEPLLVVTSEMNAKLTQVLEPILADVRRLVGDQRRMTVIFDRGGFSPKLFARLMDAGFDIITYRKGKVRKLAAGSRGIAACREKRETQEGQGAQTVSVDAGGAGVAGRRSADADPHQPPRSLGRDGGLPHLSSLASGELLQVRTGGVCPGRVGGIRGGRGVGSHRPPQSPVAAAHAAAARGAGRGGAFAERTGKRSRGQPRGDTTDDAGIQDRARRTPRATPQGRGADRAAAATTQKDAQADPGQ